MLRIVLVLALAFAFLPEGRAEVRTLFMTGKRLHEAAQSWAISQACLRGEVPVSVGYDHMAGSGLFRGFIAGCCDSKPGLGLMIPVGTDPDSLCEIVLRYLKAHPERRHLEVQQLVEMAITEAYSRKR